MKTERIRLGVSKKENERAMIRVYEELQNLIDYIDFNIGYYSNKREWERSLHRIESIKNKMERLIHNINEEQK